MSEPVYGMDAYSPPEMAKRVESAGVAKATMDLLPLFTLAFLAGAFIALGAMLYTVVTAAAPAMPQDVLLGGLTFCLGLILVVVAGAELFTGNNLIVMALVSRRIRTSQLLYNWSVVYAGNFAGALSVAVWIALSGHADAFNGAVGDRMVAIAEGKLRLTFVEAFARGVLANVLVVLAVWLCFAGRSVTDKILAILFPITAFVAAGFEHCVANMYLIPVAAVAQDATLGDAATAGDLVRALLLNNLLPVTLGNIVGGALLVGVVHWIAYLFPAQRAERRAAAAADPRAGGDGDDRDEDGPSVSRR